MKRCSGQIKYLIAIKELMDKNETVKCVHISRHLEVSRPSVSKMLRCLAASGLVCDDFCNCVRLTDEGKDAVEELYKMFGEIYTFFRRFLKLSHEDAHDQAVIFLSEFPQNTCERLGEIVTRTIKKRRSQTTDNDPD